MSLFKSIVELSIHMKQFFLDYYRLLVRRVLYDNRLYWLQKILQKLLGNYHLYKLFCHSERIGLYKYYKKESDNKRFFEGVILMFDGHSDQTGFADCLRGICSIAYMCRQCDIPLKIFYKYPFDLSSYLIPNKYDWIIGEDQLSFNQSEAEPVVAYSYSGIFGNENTIFQRKYLEDALKHRRKKQLHLYTNTDCYDDYFHEMFQYLFKPAEKLKLEIDYYKEQIHGVYVSASFRFANLLGDIKDTFGIELSVIEQNRLKNRCAIALEQIKQMHPESEKILITSDSISFLSYVREKTDFVYIIPGQIGHLAHDGENEIVNKTFLDLFLISNAEYSYMVRTPEMYRSGFAKRASMIGNKPFSEYLI